MLILGGVAVTLSELGRCLMAMDKHDEAKSCLDRSLQIKERISSDVDFDGGVAVTDTELGRCLKEMAKWANTLKPKVVWTDHCKLKNEYRRMLIRMAAFVLRYTSLVTAC